MLLSEIVLLYLTPDYYEIKQAERSFLMRAIRQRLGCLEKIR